MIKKLVMWLAYLLLPIAVGQYVFRPMAYSFIAVTDGLAAKSILIGSYLLLTLALTGFMAYELWRKFRGREGLWVAFIAMALASQSPYGFIGKDAQLLTDLQRLDELTLDPSDYRVQVRDDRLLISGTVGTEMWRAVQRTLIEHPGIALVEVNSPGGQVSPAIAIADLIRKRGLDTLAEGRCYSACTLIFLAGQERSLGPFARLGFHAAYRSLANGQKLPSLEINRAITQRFVNRGVDQDFAIKAWSYPSEDLWFPSQERMIAANYATRQI